MGIFNIDNKFFRALNKLVDMVILSFCWIISCIPVFTIGASTRLHRKGREMGSTGITCLSRRRKERIVRSPNTIRRESFSL